MSVSASPAPRLGFTRWHGVIVGVVLGCVASAAAVRYVPVARNALLSNQASDHSDDGHDHAEHEGHNHDHPSHDEQSSIEVSAQAQKNIGLKVGQVALGAFERTLNIPAVVVERPGRSEVDITAALGGIVQRIYPIQGEALLPGQPLFDLRLTHEELVQAQTEFLKTAEELDIVRKEIARLEPLEKEGAIAQKTILDRRYEERRLAGIQRAQFEGLVLHGLSAQQAEGILYSRKLLQGLTIFAPAAESRSQVKGADLLLVQQLNVERGQFVNAGERLAILAEHAELYIEGRAFEQDATWLNTVVDDNRSVIALFEAEGNSPKPVPGLKVLYVADKVETDSRTLRFFVRLPNELLRDSKTPEGNRFITWRFKPGQRLQLRVPVETWPERIVLPSDAVVQDGVEWYVFQQNGDHFDRHAVHVEYRDPLNVVVAHDGSIYPGDTIVMAGAQQLQLALKNKAGGAIDPHAGHNH